MSALLQIFSAIAGALAATVINALWQDALLVACVWLLLRAWPGVNAATRYAVWTATLIAAIAVPLATTLPFYSAPGYSPPAARVALRNEGGVQAAQQSDHQGGHVTPTAHQRVAAQPPASSQRAAALPPRVHLTVAPLLGAVIALVWLLLAAYALARLFIGLTRLEQLKRDALPLPVEYRDAMAQWMRANKGGRDVRLCVSDETDVPVAVGLFDAMILIPRSLLESLSEAEVDQISLHELAHLRRADDWTNSLQRVIMALLGWNPAAQFIGQQLDLEREIACDDWVLSFGGAVRPYALCLTKMAETSSWPRQPMAAPGVFATRKHISLRIERLLRAGRNVATSLSLGPAAAAIAVVGTISLAIAVIAPSIAMPVVTAVSNQPTAHQPAVREMVRYIRVAVAPSGAPATPAAAQGVAAPPAPALPLVAAKPSASPTAKPTASPTVVHVPGTHVHVPAQTIHVPGVDVNVPGYSYTVPTPNVDVSGVLEGVNKKVGDIVSKSIDMANRASAVAQNGQPTQNWQQNGARTCSGCNFSRVNWSGRDMHGVSYDDVNFSRASLAGTNFSGGSFDSANFNRANLRGASFANAKLTDCNFSRADLVGANFSGASLSDCTFDGANLAGAQFAGATLEDCDLNGADVTNVDFSKARLIDTELPERRGASRPPLPPLPPHPPTPPLPPSPP